ncbi:MAG: DUF192 domain-containing protein [Chloroflexi bacterium]|nr:DUF192 domain-containing protein [Chloroflexota bacterium]
MRILNETKGTVVADKAQTARSLWSKFWGLMLRSGLPDGGGLLLSPCSSIHTFFMRFPIDVVFVDRANTVVKVVPAMRPYRVTMAFRGARSALELAAGAAERARVERGDVLVVSDD